MSSLVVLSCHYKKLNSERCDNLNVLEKRLIFCKSINIYYVVIRIRSVLMFIHVLRSCAIFKPNVLVRLLIQVTNTNSKVDTKGVERGN